MKNYIWLFAIVLFTTNLYAQKKETRKVGDFSYVSMGINADVTIKQGSKTELIIEGDEEDLEEIETTVSGDKLKIRNDNNSWWGNNRSKVKIYITLKEFSGPSSFPRITWTRQNVVTRWQYSTRAHWWRRAAR